MALNIFFLLQLAVDGVQFQLSFGWSPDDWIRMVYRPLSASRYTSNCQPPMLHIKTSSPCLGNSSSLTRQQSITIFSSVNSLSITVFSSWKLLQFLLRSSPWHCLPSGIPLRLSYVLRSTSLVRLSPSLYPWSCHLLVWRKLEALSISESGAPLPEQSGVPLVQAKRHFPASSSK